MKCCRAARDRITKVEDGRMKYYIATLLLLNSLAIGQETSALLLKTHVALPNVDGRMDHFSVDIKGQRLSRPPWATILSR